MTLFGPAGTADSFKAMGYKNTLQIADYLEKFGLTRFEYQCGRGVRIDSEKAAQIGEKYCRITASAVFYFHVVHRRRKTP